MGLDISGLQIGECIYVWKSELQGSKQQLLELDECFYGIQDLFPSGNSSTELRSSSSIHQQ